MSAFADDAPIGGARKIYADARAAVVQVRILLKSTGSQSSVGSGFVATGDGFVLTNYHVASKLALEPEIYEAQFLRPDGARGALRLVDLDIVNDLAVLKLEGRNLPALTLNQRELVRGERLYSIGNPLDIGFTIVEGTYNGMVEGSYIDRVHFTGALNPGMSGGPSLNEDQKVVGVNVARSLEGQLVSFLVPAGNAAALLERAKASAAAAAAAATETAAATATSAPSAAKGATAARAAQAAHLPDWKQQIRAQLLAYQDRFAAQLSMQAWPSRQLGDYRIAELPAGLARCWSHTEQREKVPYRADSATCRIDSSIYIDEGVETGSVLQQHSLLRGKSMSAARFYAMYSAHFGGWRNQWGADEEAPMKCTEEFVRNAQVTVRAALCASAYTKFADLYDVTLSFATVDQSTQGLQSTLQLNGMGYANAMRLARRHLESVQWQR